MTASTVATVRRDRYRTNRAAPNAPGADPGKTPAAPAPKLTKDSQTLTNSATPK